MIVVLCCVVDSSWRV